MTTGSATISSAGMYRVSARGTDLNSTSRELENEIVYKPDIKPSVLLEGKIGAGFADSVIVLADGNVFVWGWQLFGNLGNGVAANSY